VVVDFAYPIDVWADDANSTFRSPGMVLLKHILFGNFWSFLLILSGIVDITIGILVLAGTISVKGSSLPVFLICLFIGLIYLAAGFAIAIVNAKKQRE
jgi:hypothetical protein